jgi:hypothetical protein
MKEEENSWVNNGLLFVLDISKEQCLLLLHFLLGMQVERSLPIHEDKNAHLDINRGWFQ